MKNYLAIDIGASSGRHILGSVKDGKIALEEVYRFENSQVRQDGHDCWDIDGLVDSVKKGIDAVDGGDYRQPWYLGESRPDVRRDG